MHHYKEIRKPNHIWGKILLFFISLYLNWKIDITISKNDTKNLTPPYLVLSNHVTYWDPFLVNMFIGEPICYIAEAIYFRNPLLRFFLNSVGAIPKKRYVKQYLPVKRLLKAKDYERILGFFPEGERKWDGTTEFNSLNTTSKLIKLLEIPVVTVTIRGGYLAYPRWAKIPRKGKVDLNYNLCLNKDECRELSLEQIRDRVQRYLTHDEVDYQRKECNKYIGRKLAEKLEYLLFTCPNCQSFNSLISNDNKLTCQQCRYGVIYNQYGFLEGLQNKLYFNNLRDWNRWQNLFLREYIKHMFKKGLEQNNFLKDDDVQIFIGRLDRPFIYKGEGSLYLNKRGLWFEQAGREKTSFRFRDIAGLSVQFQAILEFCCHENMYRFKFQNTHLSAYKWTQAIRFIKEINKAEKV